MSRLSIGAVQGWTEENLKRFMPKKGSIRYILRPNLNYPPVPSRKLVSHPYLTVKQRMFFKQGTCMNCMLNTELQYLDYRFLGHVLSVDTTCVNIYE